jgi:glycine/D-amino acid oxidase-like deaminating enzyme
VRGFWIAAGMSGHGFKLAPAVGEMMAALVTGAPSPVSPTPFRFDRFGSLDAPAAAGFVSSYLGSADPS